MVKQTRDAERQIDFRHVYAWFDGTVWPELDCGREFCGDSKCCGGYLEGRRHTHIFFLPGELAFLQGNLGPRLPMERLDNDDTQTYHCRGNSRCVYQLRPIDCRSYPVWPAVSADGLVGFTDHRGSRCPIVTLPRSFLQRVTTHWTSLFAEYPWLIDWFLEQFGAHEPDMMLEEADDG